MCDSLTDGSFNRIEITDKEMARLIRRLMLRGMTIQEIADKTNHELSFLEKLLKDNRDLDSDVIPRPAIEKKYSRRELYNSLKILLKNYTLHNIAASTGESIVYLKGLIDEFES